MVNRKNPVVVATVDDLAEDHKYSLANKNFNIAFSIATPKGEMLPYDPRYVKWLTMERSQSDLEFSRTYWPMHICSEDELRNFG